MPSLEHEIVVDLVRDPDLVRDLLSMAGIEASGRGELADTALTTPELRADLIALFGDTDPSLAVVVEIQRSVDEMKRFAWPHYESAARARHRCDTCVLVVALRHDVAGWARLPIRIGPLNSFRAAVIGPDEVPVMRDPLLARRAPSLTVLSAFAHARDENAIAVAKAAIAVLGDMKDDRATVYFDALIGALEQAARRELEEWMDLRNYTFTSEYFKKRLAAADQQGLQQGLEKGLQQGLEKGLQQGLEKGLVEGERRAMLEVLRARGIALSEENLQRIQACEDVETLRTWIGRAARAERADQIFD